MSKQTVFWKMRNGKLISVDEMDINHLRNVLKMIIRNHTNTKPKVEFKLNGDNRTCPNCNEEWMSDTCCGFDACEIDIY